VNLGPLEISEEETDQLRMALLDEMEQNSQFNVDEFN